PGPRPDTGRVPMVDHQHMGSGIYVSLGMRVLLGVDINGLVHDPLPRQGFPDVGQTTAVIPRLRMSTYPLCRPEQGAILRVANGKTRPAQTGSGEGYHEGATHFPMQRPGRGEGSGSGPA